MLHKHGNLRVRTREFARRVARACRTLPPRDRIAQVWGEQMVRAGGSAGANYREAQRGRSRAEYRSKPGDCLREADEALFGIELLGLEGCFKAPLIGPLQAECGELVAIFVSLLK